MTDAQIKNPPATITATPASAWRRQAVEGEWYRLPGSGNVVCLARPGLQAMIGVAGKVPNPISRNVLNFLAATSRLIDRANASEDERVQAWIEDQRTNIELAKLCFVHPRIVDDPQGDDQIAGEWLSDYDLSWVVYSFLEGSAERVSAFRLAASTGNDGSDGTALREAANGSAEPAGADES
jgi:hypothetical protein